MKTRPTPCDTHTHTHTHTHLEASTAFAVQGSHQHLPPHPKETSVQGSLVETERETSLQDECETMVVDRPEALHLESRASVGARAHVNKSNREGTCEHDHVSSQQMKLGKRGVRVTLMITVKNSQSIHVRSKRGHSVVQCSQTQNCQKKAWEPRTPLKRACLGHVQCCTLLQRACLGHVCVAPERRGFGHRIMPACE